MLPTPEELKKRLDPLYSEILTKIHSEFPDAIIAGGAIRDLYLGRSSNDIDVYINLQDMGYSHYRAKSGIIFKRSGVVLNRIDELLGLMVGTIHHTTATEDYQDGLICVADCDNYKGRKIQFVFTRLEVEEEVKRFGVHLSMAYFDNVKLHFTPEFLNDVKNHTLTIPSRILTDQNEWKRVAVRYLPKMKSYFPNYKIIIDITDMVESSNENKSNDIRF